MPLRTWHINHWLSLPMLLLGYLLSCLMRLVLVLIRTGGRSGRATTLCSRRSPQPPRVSPGQAFLFMALIQLQALGVSCI